MLNANNARFLPRECAVRLAQLLFCLVAGAASFHAAAQTAVIHPVQPVKIIQGYAGAGTLGNCGSLPNQTYSSFSAAVNAVKAFTSGCSEADQLYSDSCSIVSPNYSASGVCGFLFTAKAGVTCSWFGLGQGGTPHGTTGHSVAECAAKEVEYWSAQTLTAFDCQNGYRPTFTYETRSIVESPGSGEVWQNYVGDGTVFCPSGSRLWRSTGGGSVTHVTGEYVGGFVTWSNSCSGTGFPFDPGAAECGSALTYKTAKCDNCPALNNPVVGNPVNIGSGAKIQQETDYVGTGPFPLQFGRRYTNSFERASTMGRSWRHSYDVRIETVTSGQAVVVQRPDGREFLFTNIAGTWTPDSDVNGKLAYIAPYWNYTTGSSDPRGADTLELYDGGGRPRSITTRAGLTQTFTYSTAATPTSVAPHPDLLIAVADPFGRQLSFTYDAVARLKKVTDPAGGLIQFAYTAGEQLFTVTYQDGKVRTFLYNEAANTGGANLPTALTGIIDENNSRFATWQYNAAGRATLSEHAGGAGRVTITYNANSTSTVTDSLGRTETFGLGNVQGVIRQTSVTAPCAGCGTTASSTFGTNGNVSSRTDFNGNRTNYTYELPRNLESQRVEGLTAAGATTPQTRTINTQWHATFFLPTKIAEPLRITTNVYNGDGGVTCGAVGALCSRSVQATTDANGSLGFSAVLAGTPRTWTYTYDASGQVLTMDGPRTDVADTSTYTYYAANDPDPGKRGNVATITNAAGHATQVTAYDAHGKPLKIVDPNGLTTTLAYDARQRLVSRTVGGEITTYDYDFAGQLTKVTLPDSSFISYTYDAAHRLTALQDNLGNRIAYTLDGMGNRTQEQVFDPSNTLAQTRSRIYSDLNRLFKELGASSQTTEYAYDTQGNVASVKDPLNRITSNQYDPLNRLKQMTDPASGVTQYAYNGLDALSQVTDPRSLATNYTVDGLGNLVTQVSPDTGTTSSTYDTAGNLATQTDAKGQTTTYAYDLLNRVTLITFHDGSKHAYAYDLGTNGLGRLSSITESNPANQVTSILAYAYDQRGRVTAETRTVNAVDYVLAYAYDASGRLTGLTYPSGRTVTYGFDGLGRINQVTTTKDGQAKVVVQNVQYHPFGGARSWTLGNGQIYSRTVDLDGRTASYTLGSANYTVGFDTASRITDITQAGVPANTNVYGYDNLDRLSSAVLPSSNYSYEYDAVGNRTTKTTGAATDTYTYGATNNRIATLTPSGSPPRSFVFDANGSTTNDALNQFAYDTRGRMVQATSASGTTSYQVNALGQRIRKTNGAEDRVFSYDTWGKLIAESDPAGVVKREYIYLGDVPVGVLQ